MKEYLLRLSDDVELTDISYIDEDGAVWVCHHYANGLGETTADSMVLKVSPHEDLVSRSFLKAASYEIMRFPAEQAVDMYEELIENAPAVIPASGEKDG